MAFDQEKCTACEGVEEMLSDEKAQQMLSEVQDWEIVEKTIQRSFALPDFVSAMEFANEITPIAEQQNHHPDLHVSWGMVRVELSTHKVGGLSKNDFILAAKINQLWDNKKEAASI